MITHLFLATAIAASTPASPSPPALSPAEARFDACVALINKDVKKAIDFAGQWQVEQGGVPANKCLGLAYAALGQWLPAMTAFEHAAHLSEKAKDGHAADLWVQSGNAALAGGMADKARQAFETALASGMLKGAVLGEVWLDHARALVNVKDAKGARRSIDEALKLVPQDPLGWLLSATLARRTDDLERAQKDIAEAAKRSPDDASIAVEAGNIAMVSGAPDAAKTAWEAAVKMAPESVSGKAAAAALKQFVVSPAP